jgi:hypothetical protein
MQNDERLTPSERELQGAMGSLKPARAPLSRDRVMFQAGRASVRRQNRIWQGVASSLAVLLLVSVVARPRASVTEVSPDLLANDTPSVSPARFPPGPPDAVDRERLEAFRLYMRTRRALLDRGIEALPASPVSRSPTGELPLTREHLEEILSST